VRSTQKDSEQCTKMRHVYTRTRVFFPAHSQRKFVDKNGLFIFVGRHSPPRYPNLIPDKNQPQALKRLVSK